MIDGKQGVGFAAAESRLELDHRIAALTVEPFGHRKKQETHPLGDEGAFVECGGVLVFAGGFPVFDRRDVGCKFGLLEGALQKVWMWGNGFAPGFHG